MQNVERPIMDSNEAYTEAMKMKRIGEAMDKAMMAGMTSVTIIMNADWTIRYEFVEIDDGLSFGSIDLFRSERVEAYDTAKAHAETYARSIKNLTKAAMMAEEEFLPVQVELNEFWMAEYVFCLVEVDEEQDWSLVMVDCSLR